MKTEQRDPFLQSLFTEAEQALDGAKLTARVMARTRKRKLLLLCAGVAASLAALAGTWLLFGIPLYEFAVLISGALATPLINVGEGWLALLLLPVNTLAGLLVMSIKGARMIHKRISGAV